MPYTTFIAVILLPITFFVLWRTSFGLRTRSCGEAPHAEAPEPGSVAPALQLSTQQFEALALGLPWQRLGELATIRRC